MKKFITFLLVLVVVVAFCVAYAPCDTYTTYTPPAVTVPHSQTPVLIKPIEEPQPKYTAEELEILAIIIYQEAGGSANSDATRQMVGEVFLNRVASDKFPDTFREVALQKRQYGSLYWTGLKWADRANNPNEAYAVERAYATAKALLEGTVERLLPEDAIWQAEFPQGKEVLVHVPGFYFCR